MRNHSLLFITLIVMVITSMGCAAMNTALENKDLKVQTQATSTVFLAPVKAEKRTVWLEVKNTSDKDMDLTSELAQLVTSRGYKLVDDPDVAHYRLQVNIRYIGKADPSALRNSLQAGWGGPLAGAAAGGLVGSATHGLRGGLYGIPLGGLIGGAAELIAGSLVKKVTYAMVTDIQISEKSDQPVSEVRTARLTQGEVTTTDQRQDGASGWRLYRTRVASEATQVNLEFEAAKSELIRGLARSIAGIF